VKNLFSNAVEIIAEGEMDSLTEMTGWLQDGPPLASVDKLSIEWFPAENEFNSFDIVK
jgi:acylphosphatase